MHRLQRLLRDGQPGRSPGVHAECDGGRGTSPRLAPRALRARRQRRSRGARGRRRAFRARVRDRARQARLRARAPRRRSGGHRRMHALDPPLAGPRRLGSLRRVAAARVRAAAESRDRDRPAPECRRHPCERCRPGRGRHGRALGERRLQRRQQGPDPGRRRHAVAHAHTGADHARAASPCPGNASS